MSEMHKCFKLDGCRLFGILVILLNLKMEFPKCRTRLYTLDNLATKTRLQLIKGKGQQVKAEWG